MRATRIFPLAALTIPLACGLLTGLAGADDRPDGKALFLAQKCDMCHSVPSEGIEAKVKVEKMKGPDLAGTSSRVDPTELGKFLRKQADLEGKRHQKEFKGTDEELKALIDWLNALKAK